MRILSAMQQASTSLSDDTVQLVNLSNSLKGPGGSTVANKRPGYLYSQIEMYNATQIINFVLSAEKQQQCTGSNSRGESKDSEKNFLFNVIHTKTARIITPLEAKNK